ncbi:MAG: DNA-formamidopyrimidine glycosylase [Candidatus Izemoplasmatales bacterium]
MPELPEVETVRRVLAIQLIGKTIQSSTIRYEKMIKRTSLVDFQSRMVGKKVDSISRKGKYLLFHLGIETLVVHLRMEGKFYLKHPEDVWEKHEHLELAFTDGTSLRYHDTRKFGTFELYAPGETFEGGLGEIAYEPIDEAFDRQQFIQKVRKSHRPIKAILLDQSVIAGLGNIYVDETLFRAKVHPERRGHTISIQEIEKIATESRLVLEKAVELGGSTIRSYTSSLGVTGRFQNELFVHTHAGEPCPVCQTTILKTRVAGRGTYLCPTCQKRRK